MWNPLAIYILIISHKGNLSKYHFIGKDYLEDQVTKIVRKFHVKQIGCNVTINTDLIYDETYY